LAKAGEDMSAIVVHLCAIKRSARYRVSAIGLAAIRTAWFDLSYV
jgi:hypothetical protein